jgi:hypothetical protein
MQPAPALRGTQGGIFKIGTRATPQDNRQQERAQDLLQSHISLLHDL